MGEFNLEEFNGLGMHMGNLPLLSRAETRSISAENFTGEPGKGGRSPRAAGPGLTGDRLSRR